MKRKLSPKFERAMTFAIRAHQGQVRKGSGAPYISHPMAVASLVLEYGGGETQAIAALLHDVIEDCGVTRAELKRRFGRAVARIVVECSDYFGPKNARKPAWRARKETYIAGLAGASRDALLVSAADKLHNARSLVHDVLHFGPRTWDRFTATPPEIAWYYKSLLAVYRGRRPPPVEAWDVLLIELARTVRELSALARRRRR